MRNLESATDGALLHAESSEAFGVFYRRHLPWVLRWLLRRVRERELASDLAAEVFASALQGRRSYDVRCERAEPWLQAIARNVLIDSIRSGQVADRARRALGIASLELSDDDLDQVDALIDEARVAGAATLALDQLPSEQAAAIRARVIDEADYSEIAVMLRCSPSVVRQRVSRGLRVLRATLEERP